MLRYSVTRTQPVKLFPRSAWPLAADERREKMSNQKIELFFKKHRCRFEAVSVLREDEVQLEKDGRPSVEVTREDKVWPRAILRKAISNTRPTTTTQVRSWPFLQQRPWSSRLARAEDIQIPGVGTSGFEAIHVEQCWSGRLWLSRFTFQDNSRPSKIRLSRCYSEDF